MRGSADLEFSVWKKKTLPEQSLNSHLTYITLDILKRNEDASFLTTSRLFSSYKDSNANFLNLPVLIKGHGIKPVKYGFLFEPVCMQMKKTIKIVHS